MSQAITSVMTGVAFSLGEILKVWSLNCVALSFSQANAANRWSGTPYMQFGQVIYPVKTLEDWG